MLMPGTEVDIAHAATMMGMSESERLNVSVSTVPTEEPESHGTLTGMPRR